MDAIRSFRSSTPGVISRVICQAALLLFSPACAARVAAPPTTPQIFESPAGEINSFTALTIMSKDDPTHWVDYFGGSVDVDGDVLVAGAPRWGRPPGEGTGAAHVFRRSPQGEWREEATLTASDRNDGFQYDQHFGESVAVSGSVIAVGAPGYDDPQAGDNTGAVYIFVNIGDGWVETGKLIPGVPTPGARIGSSIAFDGEYLAASGSPDSGSAIIFQLEPVGWREAAQLPVPPSPDEEPYYVLIDFYGDTLALSTITRPPDDEPDEQALLQSLRRTGLVTLYERRGDEWVRTFQSDPQEASIYHMYYEAPYGLPVALGGEGGKASLLAVGKPGLPGTGRDTGTVAIFARGEGGWVHQAELELAPGEQVSGAMKMVAPDPGAAFFGAFVKFEGDRLAVVSTFANTVYLFERLGAGWAYRFRITPAPEFGDDFQRRTVAMSGDRLLVGSPGELGGGYIFLFNLPP